MGELVTGPAVIPVVTALLLDRLLGEPRRGHPLVVFGQLAARLEARWNRLGGRRRWLGIVAVVVLVAPLTLGGFVLGALPFLGPLLATVILYLGLGQRALADHALAVYRPLTHDDATTARAAVSRLVSRDTADLEASGIAAATTESVLENGHDAVFGAIFWFVVAGPAGAVAFRLVNTLDAMWGYRTPRFERFGWAAARLDDVLGWIPARLTALSYAWVGDPAGFATWRRQAGRWKSPNAGPVMAAGAGALRVRLGGPSHYHGAVQRRPRLGLGQAPEAATIPRALALQRRALALWVGGLGLFAVLPWLLRS